MNGWTADEDPIFLKYVYNNWIIRPVKNKFSVPKSKSEQHFSQIGQSKFIDKVMSLLDFLIFSVK